jgi:hypothetical protein
MCKKFGGRDEDDITPLGRRVEVKQYREGLR